MAKGKEKKVAMKAFKEVKNDDTEKNSTKGTKENWVLLGVEEELKKIDCRTNFKAVKNEKELARESIKIPDLPKIF